MRGTRAILGSLVLAASLAACGSYKGDLDTICHALERSGAGAGAPAERLSRAGKWLEQNVQSSKGKTFFGNLGMADAPTRARILREEAAKVGITTCPLADAWAAETKVRPAAPR